MPLFDERRRKHEGTPPQTIETASTVALPGLVGDDYMNEYNGVSSFGRESKARGHVSSPASAARPSPWRTAEAKRTYVSGAL